MTEVFLEIDIVLKFDSSKACKQPSAIWCRTDKGMASSLSWPLTSVSAILAYSSLLGCIESVRFAD